MKQLFLKFGKVITDGLHAMNDAEKEKLLPLKQQIIDGVYIVMMGFGKSIYIIRQLHLLQKDSIRLLNVVYKEPQQNEFCKIATACLIEILESLQRYKCEYFDREQAIPLYQLEEVSVSLSKKIPLLKGCLKGKKVDPALQEIVLHPFLTFNEKGQVSYEQVDFLLNLFENMILLLQEQGAKESDLLNLLLRKGFNTSSFKQYYMVKIAAAVNSNYKVEDQFDVLYQYEKMFSMLSKKPHGHYEPHSPSSKATLLKFVQTEIEYLHKKERLCKSAPDVNAKVAAPYRVKTSLSTDGLAYLIRLLVETEVIEASPRTELMAFIATHIQTKRNTPISPDSLYTKYRQVTQQTAIGIKALLVKMTKEINACYFMK